MLNKKFIKTVLSTVAIKNENGYIDFTFAPEIETTEEYVKVIKGMIVKKDFWKKDEFEVTVVLVKFFNNDENEEKQEVDLNNVITVNVKDLILANNGVKSVNSYAELSILDLFRTLRNDDLIGFNLREMSNKEVKII